MKGGELVKIFMLCMFLASAFAHTGVLHKWSDVSPGLTQTYNVLYADECIDEKLRGDDLSSWCEYKTNDASITVAFTWDGFLGDWQDVKGIRAGCSGTGSGWHNGVWAWNYRTSSWTDLGPCGSEGENYWDLSSDYFNPSTKQVKLWCSAQGGSDGAGDIAELFVDSINYNYNWFPTAVPQLPDPLFTHSNLVLKKGFDDRDGDLEGNSSLLWFLNDELVAENITEIDINLSIGDLVRVEYTPCDSFGQCGKTYAINATVKDYPPALIYVTNISKARGGAEGIWYVELEDLDFGQNLSAFCYIDNLSICSASGESGGNFSFNCSSELPKDTANHTFYCLVDDGLNTIKIQDDFETDVTPPTVGWLSVENYSNLTGDNPLIHTNSTGASFMRFACSEDGLNSSDWANYSTSYDGFRFSTVPNCGQGDGWRAVFVEFMDDVGNIQENHASATVFVDLTPPNTTDSYDGLIHPPGYNITIYENDSHDGNVTTTYCIDSNGSCTPDAPVNDGENITFLTRGDNYLIYLSKDSVGNEQLVQKVVRINLIPTYDARIKPDKPNTLTGLDCEVTNVSNEEGQETKPSFSWFKNGVLLDENSSTLAAGSFVRGDNITCGLVLNDGLENGEQVNATVEIGNAPPQLNLAIKETHSIVCDYTAVDPDNDGLDVSQYWLKNDRYFSNSTIVHDEEMSPGDIFTCKVNASDGFTWVTSQASYAVASPQPHNPSGGGYGGGSSSPVVVEGTSKVVDTNTTTEFNTTHSLDNNSEITPVRTTTNELIPEPIPDSVDDAEPNYTSNASAEDHNNIETGLLTGRSVFVPAFAVFVALLLVVVLRARPLMTKSKSFDFLNLKERWAEFPASEVEQEQLVLEVARRIQDRYGSFHGAGVYRVLEQVYGEQVSGRRIDVEKQVNHFLRRNPDVKFYERAGRKKLYRFD
ncbi:MAG: hypothetical protein J7L23_02435 [Candidatus Diapherotrites archaeon]|nr:hypothetical protein [Candidatus Diapherotrites archaeon]